MTRWNKQSALEALTNYVKSHGLVPARKYHTEGKFPSLRVIYQHWGRYRIALLEAGITLRSHVRWHKSEDDFLKERAGTMTIRTMAKRLNRSIPAVKYRLTLLRIGQSGNDGRYTASELARELGVSTGTVISRIHKGEYHGQKLGGIWRVDYPSDEDDGYEAGLR